MSQMNDGLKTGPISANDLMAKLANASKVMKKVEGGNFSRGNVSESMFNSNDDYEPQQNYTQQIEQPKLQTSSYPVDINKIQNSKLPDAIKKAMMENPISQISLGETLDMDFVKGAKRLIEQENNRKIVIDNKELDPTRYPHSIIQNGYKYYDDVNRGSPSGHDVKLMRTIVNFGDQQFFTGKDFEEGYLNHKKIGQPQQKREKCGKFNQKSRFHYKDNIQRVDGSTYLTNQYDTGCS